MREQPDRFVGARQHELVPRYAAGFLFGDIGRQPVYLRAVDFAVAQSECRIPRLGDHPVRAQAVIKLMREGHEGIGRMWSTGAVGGDPDAARIDVKNRSVEAPAIAFHASQEHSHKTEAALMKGAHTLEPHHLPRWAKAGHCRLARQNVRIVAFSHLPIQNCCQRNAASSRL